MSSSLYSYPSYSNSTPSNIISSFSFLKLKDFFTPAILVILGNVFSAIFTFFFALDKNPMVVSGRKATDSGFWEGCEADIGFAGKKAEQWVLKGGLYECLLFEERRGDT